MICKVNARWMGPKYRCPVFQILYDNNGIQCYGILKNNNQFWVVISEYIFFSAFENVNLFKIWVGVFLTAYMLSQ